MICPSRISLHASHIRRQSNEVNSYRLARWQITPVDSDGFEDCALVLWPHEVTHTGTRYEPLVVVCQALGGGLPDLLIDAAPL